MTGDLSLMCPEFIQGHQSESMTNGKDNDCMPAIQSYYTTRVITLTYQPFAPTISAIFAYHEAKANTRLHNLVGYTLFFFSSLALVTLDLVSSGRGGIAIFVGAEEGPALSERLSNKQLLVRNMDYALNMFLIYMLTLSVFPGFLAEDVRLHSLGSWYALVLITSYNAWDLIGRYLPLIRCIKLTSRKGLSVAVFTRFLLLQAFYYAVRRSG
ncbi:hypothetical protein E2562_017892 [Oryza meyeriana var. granulata]|uniref:Uncharacterized protein n=1 Tax=Oryza meyeriana var. granulata TaxID=110450 RepID=A0A6G1CQS1_9ORYZ|nr:hypothetical protein E2562_017892 [Oryza meyeriana var. granulata]